MSYSQFYKPVQKVAYKYVDHPTNNYSNNNQSNEDNQGNYDDNYNGDENEQYITNQSNIISKQHQSSLGTAPDHINKYPHDNIIGSLRHGAVNQPEVQIKKQPDQYHNYDPYYEYLRKSGSFVENNRTRINTRTYSISSSARTITPQIVTKNRTALSKNALIYDTITENIGVSTTTRDVLSIYCPNHQVSVGDQITLSGIVGESLSLKSIYNDKNGDTQNAIIFTNYSTAVIFKCNFDTIIKDPNTGLPTSKIDTSMSFDPSFKIGMGIDYTDLKNYDTSDMYVTLSGFDISSIGMPFVGNVPINFLNSSHRVYFTNPDFKVVNGTKIYSPDTVINVPNGNNKIEKITGFYILLQVPFINNAAKTILNSGSFEVSTGNPMIIDIMFNYIGGIPLNVLNAHYPVDVNNVNGSHEVHSVTTDTINIVLNKKTYYKNPSSNNLSETNVAFGGIELEMATLDSVLKGHSSPNFYSVELPNAINNVVMAKLTSITLPNTAKVFTNISGSQNNKIYWQNQDDGDFVYSAEIPSGNYSPTELGTVLGTKIYEVPRKYVKSSNQGTSYTDRTFMAISIDIPTNSVTFSGFKEAVLRKPIQDINPPIPKVGDGTPPYTLSISQSNHGLLPGNSVTFAGFVATNGIPAGILNTTHTIVSVPNVDTFTIQINNFNLLSGSRTESGGGFVAKILVPSAFRLLFNYKDTVGKELGFRKVGEEFSVTPFKTTISNFDPYDNEILSENIDGTLFVSDSSGNKSLLGSNSLKLDGHDYVLMVIRKFDNIVNISNNKKITSYFAKVNLRGLPGTMSYDDYICPPLTFYEPIEVSKLDISFYTPDGELYDFDGIEHNFTLEITNIEYVPLNTGIVSTLAMF